MESQGKMLVALSVIAVLSGLSAISYVAVQQNAHVNSRAAYSTSPSGLITCTSNQDCIDFAIAKGMCKAGTTCTPGGGSFDCVGGTCTVVGVSASVGSAGGTGSSLSGLAAATPVTTPDASANPGTNTGATCGTKSSGDFDCNGKVECADLTLFVNEFTGKVATKNSDVTNDGKVSLADFEMGRAAVASSDAWANCQL